MKSNNNNNIHSNHRKRMIDKLLSNGYESFEKHEILEMMLYYVIQRKDTNALAQELLNKYKSIKNICTASVEELCEFEGIGEQTARFINAIPLFFKYYEDENKKLSFMSDDKLTELKKYCISLTKNCEIENLYLLAFNNTKLIKTNKIAQGIADSVEFAIKEVLNIAINTKCNNIYLLHNHPSGVLKPSQNDIVFTRKTAELLDNIGVELSDHYITCEDRIISMREIGMLKSKEHFL